MKEIKTGKNPCIYREKINSDSDCDDCLHVRHCYNDITFLIRNNNISSYVYKQKCIKSKRMVENVPTHRFWSYDLSSFNLDLNQTITMDILIVPESNLKENCLIVQGVATHWHKLCGLLLLYSSSLLCTVMSQCNVNFGKTP